MSQEKIPERDPMEEWWATHRWDTATAWRKPKQQAFEWFYEEQRRENPWCNGRYAIAALVWGLIFMLVLSVAP